VAQKIFSRNGVRKNLFLQNVKKDILGGCDEGVSNFKKSQTINTTSSMTKSPSLMTKVAAAAKKKAGKLDLFQSNFTKLWFLLYCILLREFVVCLPPLFISFFDEQRCPNWHGDHLIGLFS
jgi:hypothetical protein